MIATPQLNTTAKYGLTLLTFIAIIVGLYFISSYDYLLFHGIVELFSVTIAFSIFAIAWNSRNIANNNYFLFVGIAFLFIGCLDLLHALAYEGMGVFPEYGSNLPTQLWIATRYLFSFSLFFSLFFVKRKVHSAFIMTVYTIVTCLVLLSIFYWNIFPQTYIEGVGLTPFKIVSEYVISFIFICTIGLLFVKRKNFSDDIFKLIIFSILAAILSEMAFTLYNDVYGIANMAGHLLSFFSFFLIYRAMIVTALKKPYNLLFRDIKQKETLLTKHSEELTKTNEQLLNEIKERKKAEEALKISEKIARNHAEELQQAQTDLKEKAIELEEYATRMEELAEERASKLRDAERLAAIGATAGMIGHDIRNPLQSIDGAIYLAKDAVTSSSVDDAKQKEILNYLSMINEQVAYIDHMVLDLQDFAKESTPHLEKTNILSLIDQSLSMIEIPDNIKVNIDVTDDFKTKIDPEQMKRVFVNLINNAIQAMPEGGKLIIKASKTKKYSSIAFQDTGVGIPDEIKTKIFTPLFTTKAKGQGFGLAVCKKLVEAHGGKIAVKSKLREGTTFTIKLRNQR